MSVIGHKSRVMTTAFSPDENIIVSVSMDGTIRATSIDVRYRQAEDPKLLWVQPLALPPGHAPGLSYSRISISSGLVAASCGSTVHILSLKNGELLDRIEAAHGESTIEGLEFAPLEGKAILASYGGKSVRLWNLVYKAS